MEIEKTLCFDASPVRVWALLLDPNAMGACVPGMESIEVISDAEYLAVMKVKISFISARFRLKTRIVERDEPRYLRAEGTGEDASVASSLKQVSEMWLAEREGGGTELRMKVKVDVLGRMGTFGLGVMKTKADRLWDEFGVNANTRLADRASPAAVETPGSGTPAAVVPPSTASTPETVAVATATTAGLQSPVPTLAQQRQGWWARLLGRHTTSPVSDRHIRVEWRRGDTLITVDWPVEQAGECTAWLRETMR
jgi:uncharacterized protein